MESVIIILRFSAANIHLDLHIKTRINSCVHRIVVFVRHYSGSCGTFADFKFTAISLEQIWQI